MERKRLIDVLLERGDITESQLQEASRDERLSLCESLVANGAVTEEQLISTLTSYFGVQLFSISKSYPAYEALRLVPREFALQKLVVPFSVADALLVGTPDPTDERLVDELRAVSGKDVNVGALPVSEVSEIKRVYDFQTSAESAYITVKRSEEAANSRYHAETGGSGEAPIIQMADDILEKAVLLRASDIHIEPFESMSRVRFRIDGKLHDLYDFPVELQPPVVSRLKIISDMDIAEKRRPQDGRILVRVIGRKIDLRVSTVPTIYGEKIMLRVLDPQNAMVGLENLGLHGGDKAIIDRFCRLPFGFLLVTGPTGSGKTTTLYSIIKQLNKSDVNIVTIEDPVEYTFDGVNQIQVNERIGLTFDVILRSVLRQDPDKIMVGEIRDLETAQLAVRAALTGHLVLSTLHTSDAVSSIARLRDMGIPSYLIAASLSGVVAQRLVRKLCPKCKHEYELPEELCAQFEIPSRSVCWTASGCPACGGSGYSGRVGVYEIMTVDDDLRELIQTNASDKELRQRVKANGMTLLRSAGIKCMLDGVTSPDEILSSI